MGLAYNMSVEISGHDVGRTEAIKIAAKCEWDFDFWNENSGTLSASADGNLCFRVPEEQFAELLSLAVWRANGKFCNVEIVAGCLEEIPYETHSFSEVDYLRITKDDKSLNPDHEEHFYTIQECGDTPCEQGPDSDDA